MTLEERFWSKVKRTNGCWLWQGSTSAGHGRFNLGGRPVGAHRVALMLSGVEIPEGHHVHHKCEVRGCVNPEHLEVLAGHAEHAKRHLRGCGKHGFQDIRFIKSGKNVGMRYCGMCNLEKATARYWALHPVRKRRWAPRGKPAR